MHLILSSSGARECEECFTGCARAQLGPSSLQPLAAVLSLPFQLPRPASPRPPHNVHSQSQCHTLWFCVRAPAHFWILMYILLLHDKPAPHLVASKDNNIYVLTTLRFGFFLVRTAYLCSYKATAGTGMPTVASSLSRLLPQLHG